SRRFCRTRRCLWFVGSNPATTRTLLSQIVSRICVAGGEGGIAAAIVAAGPSGPALRAVQNRSRRFCRTRRCLLFVCSNPATTRTLLSQIVSRVGVTGGEGGIRTHEHPLRCYWNSSPAPSTTRPPLRSKTCTRFLKSFRTHCPTSTAAQGRE